MTLAAITAQSRQNDQIPDDVYRVLLTGYTPFGRHKENNSWLAVAPLNNLMITLDVPDYGTPMEEDLDSENPSTFFHPPRRIHISCLLLPVTYKDVLKLVPPLHARPPIILPSLIEPNHIPAPPPESGYDLIFHVGLAGRGGLRMERLGHKTGYKMKDSIGEHAPIVTVAKAEQNIDDPSNPTAAANTANTAAATTAAATSSISSLGSDKPLAAEVSGPSSSGNAQGTLGRSGEGASPVGAPPQEPSRGFDKGYENMADDFYTGIDVERLVHDLKAEGVQNLYTSMDAGHYVSDYTFYCSLAEAKRTAQVNTKGKHTKVLFMHCPPANQPFPTEQVSDSIVKTVIWVSQTHDA